MKARSGEHKLIVEKGIVAGNAYDKYGTRNPLARAMMDRFLRAFRGLVRKTGASAVHEVGCGEGHLAVLLAQEGLKVRASDFSHQVVEQAHANIKSARMDVALEVASIYDLRPPNAAEELVVCCEVLEHLPDPNHALEILSTLGRPNLILSVPREPVWRALNMCRGKYLSQCGNTPGHLNHWSQRSFIRFVRQRLEVVECRSPFPWTMLWCRARQ